MKQTRGERFVESLRDGRQVWLDGQVVSDVTRHPAFTGTLRTLRTLFDMLDDPGRREIVGFASDTTGEYVHNAFLVPQSMNDLQRRREAFALWSKETHGVMSRLSEYARSLVTGWYAARERFRSYDPQFPAKIAQYYEQARDEDRFITTAVQDPQIDRSKDIYASDHPDAYLRIVGQSADGVVIRGAKMIATAAPYAHDVIITQHQKLREGDSRYAFMAIVELNSPGVHIVCREPFASPDEQRHPLSARYEEMDAVLIFDNVFVPWERVFLHGSADGVWQVQTFQTQNLLAFHQTVVRLLAKLEFVAGVAFAVAQSIGVDRFLHVQEMLGELITQVESVRGLLIASEAQAGPDEFGTFVPAGMPLQTARNAGLRYYPRAIEILQQIGAGGYMQIPSSTVAESGAIRPLLETYYQGAGIDADRKVRLFKLAWDLIGTPLASRHELYERYYTGDPVRMYALQYQGYDKSALKRRIDEFWQRTGQEGGHSDERGQSLSIAVK